MSPQPPRSTAEDSPKKMFERISMPLLAGVGTSGATPCSAYQADIKQFQDALVKAGICCQYCAQHQIVDRPDVSLL